MCFSLNFKIQIGCADWDLDKSFHFYYSIDMEKRMLNFIAVLLVVLFSGMPVYAEGQDEEAGTLKDGKVPVSASFYGFAEFDLEDVFGGMSDETAKPVVIKTRQEFVEFVDTRIPTHEMTKRQPPPESDDPLLKKPDIDFGKRMMIVIFSIDENQFIDLRITKIVKKKDIMTVYTDYTFPDPEEIHQKIINYGFYYAVVVPRFNGEVVFK